MRRPTQTGSTVGLIFGKCGGSMGAAPEILEELRLTPEQRRDNERHWFLDTATGEFHPEDDPAEEPRSRPRPIPVARHTYD
jgi:hypothetical protein